MKRAIYILFLLLVTTVFNACKKHDALQVSEFDTEISATIRSIKVLNGKVIIAGGNNKEKGIIGELSIGDGSFNLFTDTMPFAVYDMVFSNNRYFFTCDSARIWFSNTLHDYFEHWVSPENWIQENHKEALRQIAVSENGNIHIAGGGKLNAGVRYSATDVTGQFKPEEFDNEMRFVAVCKNKVWAGGFGMLESSNDYGETWEHIAHEGCYFTSAYFYSVDKGVLSDYEGKIYSTNDGGVSLKKVFKKRSTYGKVGINRLIVNDFNTDVIIAVGAENMLLYSNDQGGTWEEYSVGVNEELKDALFISEKELIAVGTNGTVVKITMP